MKLQLVQIFTETWLAARSVHRPECNRISIPLSFHRLRIPPERERSLQEARLGSKWIYCLILSATATLPVSVICMQHGEPRRPAHRREARTSPVLSSGGRHNQTPQKFSQFTRGQIAFSVACHHDLLHCPHHISLTSWSPPLRTTFLRAGTEMDTR